jgi:hypothetical protein
MRPMVNDLARNLPAAAAIARRYTQSVSLGRAELTSVTRRAIADLIRRGCAAQDIAILYRAGAVGPPPSPASTSRSDGCDSIFMMCIVPVSLPRR